ncbi:MAG: PAC2 family protein [Dehalococcoidales bacterium]|nr:PAC2 family protein [Dehalococcoidales bacterium]
MGVRLFNTPELTNPDMVIGWPGIGNVGLIAIDILRQQLGAELFGEVEGWDFFYPKGLTIRSGLLEELDFPGSKFYFKKLGGKDLIIFIGEEQPAAAGGTYAQGGKAYQMAGFILDVAQKFGCRRVFTSGAAVALSHHAVKPRVWAVTTREALIAEIRSFENVVLMGEVEGKGGQGSITGLNGLTLGVAKKRGLDGYCLMGEVPDYLAQAPFPYPRASKSVLEVVGRILGVNPDAQVLDGVIAQMDDTIEGIYQKFPDEIRQRIDQRKSAAVVRGETITEEDETWIKDHIDDFFRGKGGGNERPV